MKSQESNNKHPSEPSFHEKWTLGKLFKCRECNLLVTNDNRKGKVKFARKIKWNKMEFR